MSALSERRVLNLMSFTPVCNTMFLNGPISEAEGMSAILAANTFLPGIHFPNILGPSPKLRVVVGESPAKNVEFMLNGATARMVTLHLTSVTLVSCSISWVHSSWELLVNENSGKTFIRG